MLHRKEADLSFSDMTITSLRSEVVSFSIPISAGSLAVFAKVVQSGKWSLTMYLGIFGADCWLAMLLITVLLAAAFSAVFGFDPQVQVSDRTFKQFDG